MLKEYGLLKCYLRFSLYKLCPRHVWGWAR